MKKVLGTEGDISVNDCTHCQFLNEAVNEIALSINHKKTHFYQNLLLTVQLDLQNEIHMEE